MPRWKHTPASATNAFGFPSLTAPGDQFDTWVSAASAYVAANSAQADTGAANVASFGDSSGLWQTSGSYQYTGKNAVNADGLVVFPPAASIHFASLDTASLSLSVLDHPTQSLGSTGYWYDNGFRKYLSVRWAPSSDRFYFAPDYAYRYLSWDGDAGWNDWLRTYGENNTPSTSFQQRGTSLYFDGYVYQLSRSGSGFITKIDTSSDSMEAFTPSGLTTHNAALGPDGKAYCFGLNTIQTLDLATNAVATVASTKAPDWYSIGGLVDEVTGPCLAADGTFWVFPASRNSSGLNSSTYLAVRFDPFDNSVTQVDWRAGPTVEEMSPSASGGSFLTPCLMPDGRLMVGAYYSRAVKPAGTTTYLGTYGPHTFDPATGEWMNGADRYPFGSGFTMQWGLHGAGSIGADGRWYPSPARIAAGGQYGNPLPDHGYGGRFLGPPDVMPPPEFYASPYKT